MRILYISEVQWLSQVSRKHLLIRRFPRDWHVVFVSPANARAGENSFRMRTDLEYGHVRYASLPLPKPDSTLPPVRALTGLLSVIGGRRLKALAASTRPDVVVCSYIWAAPVVPAIKRLGVPVIYDLNDLHYEFYPAGRERAEEMFRNLVAVADEVVSSSKYLCEVAGRGGVIGNGVDLRTFTGRDTGPLPPAIAESPLAECEELVAYVGSVDDRIDFAVLEGLLKMLAAAPRKTGVICVGRVFDSARDRKEDLGRRFSDRILFTGRVPYEELPRYLSHAGVGIAPFARTPRTRAINPNKLYMYAAMEMNIVSTPFSDEIGDYRDLVFLAERPDDFAAAVMTALGDEERRRAVRERIALPNSWDEKAIEFARLLSRTAGRG